MTAADQRLAARVGELVPSCSCDPPEARDTGGEIRCENCHTPYRAARVPQSARRLARTCACHDPMPASWLGRRWCLRCGGDVTGHGGAA